MSQDRRLYRSIKTELIELYGSRWEGLDESDRDGLIIQVMNERHHQEQIDQMDDDEELRRPRNFNEPPPEKPATELRRPFNMVEYEPGKWRSADVQNYDDCMWPSSYSVFSDLIYSKFIDLNLTTGTATQLRDYKTGRELEKPLPIRQIECDDYYCLEVEVWGSPKTTRTVRMRVHDLVYRVANISNMTYDEWVCHMHGKQIHHKDGDTSHNWISNLVALTPDEHRKVGKKTGAHKQTERGISRDDPVVTRIKELSASGLSSRKIEKQTGISYRTICKIIADTYKYREPSE
jgi:hypothetical protein